MIKFHQIAIQVAGAPDDFAWRAARILSEEIALRSGQAAEVSAHIPENVFGFLIGTEAEIVRAFPAQAKALSALPAPGPEGFRLLCQRDRIVVAGADGRGCLYGMAHALRKMALKPGFAALTDELTDVSLTPSYPLRGHQLAYRDKQNTCPGWGTADFDRYIRDLALFGTNAVEILPPRTDDRLFSPKFGMDPLEMMARLSEIIHSYGMDVWVWYPNMGKEYEDPKTRAAEIAEREKVYAAVPYVDAVLIPAGDPGELEPKDLFPVAEESTLVLHTYHPNATVWIAPQVFAPRPGWHEEFYQELSKEPDWLYGVCFAPWMYETLPEFHARVPEKYKSRIRHYPDITHNSSAQFEMGDWDLPFALLNGRESYNARPRAMKHIHNLHAPYTVGSITYSEGIHDDVNKMVWGDQDFRSDRPVEETLRDYVRLFIDPDLVEDLVPLILSFEDSWVGYARDNETIDRVYEAFTALSQRVPERVRDNYRFKMAHLRALTDYQAKHRAIYDAALEKEAYAALKEADQTGADAAMQNAWDILNRTFDEPVNERVVHLMQRLADELYKTPGCRIQLTTAYHQGQSWIRGAYLDAVHLPLNDYQFLTEHFRRIRRLPTEAEKLAEIRWLLTRRDPGPGGQYACLGDLDDFRRHVVSGHTWEEDPGFLRSPMVNSDPYGLMMVFHRNRRWHGEFPISMNWVRRARVIYGTPLVARFDGLEKNASYLLRVAYPDALMASRTGCTRIKLTANGRLIHDRVDPCGSLSRYPVFEYELPKEATETGEVTLMWQKWGTLDRVSVSEVWLVKRGEGAQ